MFKIFASLQNRMEGRVLLQIWIFCFYMAPYVHTCSLARWLSHMGAPLLDYFPPSDGNLSPLEKIFSPCFSSALFCPQFCTGDFASKGSFPLLISALCKLWQPRCRALTEARKKMWNCDFVWTTWNCHNFWPSILNSSLFSEKHRKNCECCPGHYLSTSVY